MMIRADAAFGDSNWVLMQDNAHIHIGKAMVKALSMRICRQWQIGPFTALLPSSSQ
jgi:hypothetical protein